MGQSPAQKAAKKKKVEDAKKAQALLATQQSASDTIAAPTAEVKVPETEKKDAEPVIASTPSASEVLASLGNDTPATPEVLPPAAPVQESKATIDPVVETTGKEVSMDEKQKVDTSAKASEPEVPATEADKTPGFFSKMWTGIKEMPTKGWDFITGTTKAIGEACKSIGLTIKGLFTTKEGAGDIAAFLKPILNLIFLLTAAYIAFNLLLTVFTVLEIMYIAMGGTVITYGLSTLSAKDEVKMTVVGCFNPMEEVGEAA